MAPPLPTPPTSHLSFATIYSPAEDSFLLLDTLASPAQQAFFRSRFACPPISTSASTTPSSAPARSSVPLVLEVGTGSGVLIAFLLANAQTIFGRRVVGCGVDVNVDACRGTAETVKQAIASRAEEGVGGTGTTGVYLGSLNGDLTSVIRDGEVDVLVCNPPYVPTEELPPLPSVSGAPPVPAGNSPATAIVGEGGTAPTDQQKRAARAAAAQERHERESHLLALSYAGGKDGMEVTERLLGEIPRVLSRRGVAFVLFCARNGVEEVRGRVEGWPGGGDDNGWKWRAEVVAESGGKGGWERLSILRIWRDWDG